MASGYYIRYSSIDKIYCNARCINNGNWNNLKFIFSCVKIFGKL